MILSNGHENASPIRFGVRAAVANSIVVPVVDPQGAINAVLIIGLFKRT
jgi:hypothetical protein